ncbi:hypothetical protein DFA_01562 [Cavenderia fasciculata]|uniref:ComC supersandwich domain-containing protein n=1 Tax=Cavenderia fasciculata TaxID=261658 RepID=F4PTF4_CACFS|nr:uncharacterized protein DFA_01562 [Cavenderia fasciculata]EGG21676.1 hypothetical protein DFA_01562 [Cavenderia fasciculata]|eukprot:XP_004359526.1 hypothetical protein DFA_01562 [Cavenderia fasciculata]
MNNNNSSSSNNRLLILMIVTLLCCHYHISLSNAQQTIPDDERIQYGMTVPQNQSLCLDQGSNKDNFFCSNKTLDGQYRIVEIRPGVTNQSINILELLKSSKSLDVIDLRNDRSITWIPNDFNNFPNLSNVMFILVQPLIVPLSFLNNSINLKLIDFVFPVSSISIDDSLYFPSLQRYSFDSACTYGSHHINVTSKSFPKLKYFNSFYKDCSKPYPIISSGNYNSTNNKYVQLNGDFGPSSNRQNLSIMINSTIKCVVGSVSQFQINCTLDQQPLFGLASVQLQFNDLNTLARDLLNLQSQQPSQPSSKSECETITFKYINTTVAPNTTDPTVSFDFDGVDFLFEIVSVQELDLDGNIVKEIFISNYTWNVNASTINNHTTNINYQLNTSSSLSNNSYQPAQVQSTISFSTQPRTVEFGGKQLLMNANSIKLEVNISKWQYSSNLATLRVVFKTLINNNQSIEYDCINKDIESFSYDSLSSLQYLRVVKDGIQFNGRFIDVAMSDGRPTYSPTQLISSTRINDQQSIVMIGIVFPQCQSCILDPDFSALIVDTSNNSHHTCDNDDPNNQWKMITGIVVGVVGAVALSIVTLYGIKRFKRYLVLRRKSIAMSKIDK